MEDAQISIERLTELIGDKSLAEFCREVGLSSKQSVSAYLKGERSPKLSFVKAVADRYGVSIPWLMGYDVPKRTEDPADEADEDLRILLHAAKRSTPAQRRAAIAMLQSFVNEAEKDSEC